jgi:hypothetical protein
MVSYNSDIWLETGKLLPLIVRMMVHDANENNKKHQLKGANNLVSWQFN